jgi:dihydrofolate synthase / dihydropteroate synthase
MEYHEAADVLTSLQRHRPKLGTETTAKMLSHFENPEVNVDFVQVAGSNGKGSTTCLLESVLRTAGLDVGIFTSPCLNDFREQIRVNGRTVSKERIAGYVERLIPCFERLRTDDDMPTHFEVLTALAIHHFGVEDVDIAILEVGIGGRYDATSVVDPVASAVTSVSLEHTDLLGDTVEEIARDKAQVAPSGKPLVTGADGAALEAIQSMTDTITVGATDADVIAAENGMRSDVESNISIAGPDWTLETNLSLLGQYQATNAGVAAALARQVSSVDVSTMAKGLRKATCPGRFEIVSTEPMIVLDGSHNPAAASKLSDLLGRYNYDDLHVAFAAMADKDYEEMISELPAIGTAFITRPNIDRAEDVAVLADAFDERGDQVYQVESVQEATERALAVANETDFVLVTGSLYAVAEARDRWTRLVVPKNCGRQANEYTVVSGTGFPEGTVNDINYRILTTVLRRDQAVQVDQRLKAIGGTCVCSEVGAPGKLVTTVLAGTVSQLRELADIIETDGFGLRHLARQLRTALNGSSDSPFDGDRTAVMGILNVTPDSFYDGGKYNRLDTAVERAEQMVASGADIVDIGGESTRPGAGSVPVSEEIDRVVPVIESISSLDVPISVDTRKAAVAEAALNAGADIVNDVSGLADPEMRFVVANHDASLVLLHSLSAPVDPNQTGRYDDVVDDVLHELSEQVMLAKRAGIDREQIIVDPGCGFGKGAAESFDLVNRLPEFRALGCPVMVGHSRKSMFERVACRSGKRLPPTLAVTAIAAERGADIVRVHDVAENATVVRTVAATDDL